MPGMVKLSVVAGPMKGTEFCFDEHDTFLFGRAPECHASLPDDSFVSRYHFILETNPPDVRLRDLGSLNGTFVNGRKCGGTTRDGGHGQREQRATQQVDLRNGDRIQVGETTIAVTIDVPLEATVPMQCGACGRPLEFPVGKDLLGNPCAERAPATAAEPMAAGGNKPASLSADHTVPQVEGYAVMRKLGEGGMGLVYLARRNGDGSEVALKIVRAQVVVQERARRMFLREINFLRGLEHPNIVRLLDSGSAGAQFHFAMEYCNQGSLDDLAGRRGGALPLDLALAILRQVLKGLAHAHGRDLVHRDIKPQNILLHGRGKTRWRAKLSDFGLAKNFSEAGLSGMTATGSYGGTYHFMPREQLTDFKYVKPASDVWSAAAVFYRIATGCFPRDVKPGQDPLEMILYGEVVPIQNRNRAIPSGIAGVISRALANAPEARYASATEFRKALEDVR